MRVEFIQRLKRSNDPDDQARYNALRCAYGDHNFERTDDRSYECGCPSDPGIHFCYIYACSLCHINENDCDVD